jgi:hypothetical protein
MARYIGMDVHAHARNDRQAVVLSTISTPEEPSEIGIGLRTPSERFHPSKESFVAGQRQ